MKFYNLRDKSFETDFEPISKRYVLEAKTEPF